MFGNTISRRKEEPTLPFHPLTFPANYTHIMSDPRPSSNSIVETISSQGKLIGHRLNKTAVPAVQALKSKGRCIGRNAS
jgi:hypothetical protein